LEFEFAADIYSVILYGFDADAEGIGDLVVRHSGSYKSGDASFAAGKCGTCVYHKGKLPGECAVGLALEFFPAGMPLRAGWAGRKSLKSEARCLLAEASPKS